jgi:hypothetical protein
MIALLVRGLRVSPEAALVLISSVADARPGQVAAIPGLNATAYLEFPASALATRPELRSLAPTGA